MKNLFLLVVFLAFGNLLHSQNLDFSVKYTAQYEFEFQYDSLNSNSKRVLEPYFLYFNDHESFFISSHRLNLDTLLYGKNAVNMTQMTDLMKMPKASSNIKIFNSIQPKSISLIDEINGKSYFIIDAFQLKWKLSNESDSIGTLKVKKAETRFRGRDYIAWYCEELPFSFGPYKFSGLPGLIIKIHDSQNYIQYTLTNFKQTEANPLKIDYNQSVVKGISKTDFRKLSNSYLENPVTNMESEGYVFNDETKKIIKDRFAERRKRNNNKIELTDE